MHSCTLETTQDLLSISAAQPALYPYLLDSAATGPLGRCSLLLRSQGEALYRLADGTIKGPGRGDSFLARLNQWYLQERQADGRSDRWPFIGGWFVYLGYELAAEVEPVVSFPLSEDGLPVAFAARCPAVIYSLPENPGKLHLVAESKALLRDMQQSLEKLPASGTCTRQVLTGLSEDPPEAFKSALEQVHEYILNGDVFQVNLSRGWCGRFKQPVDVVALYRSLRTTNPAPFAGLVRWGQHVLMSSSPERLVRTRGVEVNSRPIAGTHPRGINHASDQALSAQLIAHPKERAEHIMLIDLERNDLGRVCETGSVEVNELMVVESYQHVHHIVSNVQGRLRPGVTPVDVIRAVFPGGTITGCPKVRCMQIIAELEPQGRSFYTGSFGYLGVDGSMDLNILIRSMLLHRQQVSFRTGAGIVADSDPETEIAETRHKARGLLRALGQSNA